MPRRSRTQSDDGEWRGKVAPDFELLDQHGEVRRLSEFGGRWVVLFFYPKDMSEGCTREACGFRDEYPKFTDLGVVLLGVSILGVKSKAAFANRHRLQFPILADEDHSVAESYGVWVEKCMYGRNYMGVSRETLLIAPDGVIVAHWTKAKASGSHACEVLNTLLELRS